MLLWNVSKESDWKLEGSLVIENGVKVDGVGDNRVFIGFGSMGVVYDIEKDSVSGVVLCDRNDWLGWILMED